MRGNRGSRGRGRGSSTIIGVANQMREADEKIHYILPFSEKAAYHRAQGKFVTIGLRLVICKGAEEIWLVGAARRKIAARTTPELGKCSLEPTFPIASPVL